MNNMDASKKFGELKAIMSTSIRCEQAVKIWWKIKFNNVIVCYVILSFLYYVFYSIYFSLAQGQILCIWNMDDRLASVF